MACAVVDWPGNLREVRMYTLLKEEGRVSWISEKRPVKALCCGIDVTDRLSGSGLVYTLSLPEKGEKAVITVTWEK